MAATPTRTFSRRKLSNAAAWTRDAVAEAVPATLLCREDCAGLCPQCGADLNAGPCGCEQEEHDPRWDALKSVAERLSGDRADTG